LFRYIPKGKIEVELFHPDRFRFSGAVDNFENREDFASALADKVGPHLTFGKIRRQFVDGNDICTIYDFKAGASLVPTAEWIHAENGYITEISLIFDPRQLVPTMALDSPSA
jgi:hypothetical protein